jgi:hypothetical protein
MSPAFATRWELSVLHCGRFPQTHRDHKERFNLKKLNEVEDKEQYHAEISNRFAASKVGH